ncbi:MAG: hypothetical protein ABI151_14830, partial [Chitinophagaceae bacterium]
MLARRELIRKLTAAPLLSLLPASLSNFGQNNLPVPVSALKISLNAYSFNEPLTKGKINLEGLLDFCAEQNFDA